ncbi:MAG TPA: hypothetical protein VJ455_07680 [Ignavibacteria bacterium]|nr:hypothetical protein [Ignavibacteria bacterium]
MPVAFKALIITIAVEFIIYLIIQHSKPFLLFGAAILINCITQPPAFYAYNYLINSTLDVPSIVYFLVIEITVFVIEIFLIKLLLQISYERSAFISFSANLITALLSFIL